MSLFRFLSQPRRLPLQLPKRWSLSTLMPFLPGLLAGGVAMVLLPLHVWQPLEYASSNTLMRLHARLLQPQWDRRIVVIAIDEASLQQYGRFPWSRTRYQQLLQALAPAVPAGIGFDILFAEADPQDPHLAEACFNTGNVVLAMGADRQGRAINVVPTLAQVTRQGHVYNLPDADGISRRSWLSINQVPSLAMALLVGDAANRQAEIAMGNLPSMPPHPLPAPQSAAQPMWVNWVNSTDAIATVSFIDVVQGKVDPAVFTDKFVLVGITATGFDPLLTPFTPKAPTAGVYLHAAALDNLLNHRWLHPLPEWALWGVILLVGSLTSTILHAQTWRQRLLTVLGLVGLWWLVALLLLHMAQVWLAIAAPLGTILLTAMVVQLREQYEKQLLMQLFAKHVAPETAAMLWQRKSEILHDGELKAQELVATVLFVDIRGFTTISEQLPPGELLSWVNRYLDTMTDCIMQQGGVIDKYIGDAIMAVFGVPFPRTTMAEIQQDALNAIAASLEMHQRLQHLNQELAAEGKPIIKIGIGVHTGSVVAGSIGGQQRLNYSVLGDAVNVAARLEGLNKEVNGPNPYSLLVTGDTLSCLRQQYRTHCVGHYPLKGREHPALVFAILGET